MHVYSYIYATYILTELKSGRIPDGIRRMGFWKAEEYQKFTFPASEFTLKGIIPEENYQAWILIVRITELIFNTCRSGWTPESVDLLRMLIWRHNILTEEVEGFQNCTITLHNLLHLVDDIKRFSSPDNFWCYVFERAVHKYVIKSSNNKNLELTFAQAEIRQEVLKFSTHSVSTQLQVLDPSQLQVCSFYIFTKL